MAVGLRHSTNALHMTTGALGLALFFLMLFVPHTYRPVKALLLVLLLGGIGLAAVRGSPAIRLHKSVATWTMILSLTCAFFLARGVINNAPGAMDIRSVYVLAPVLFATIIAAIPGGGLRALMVTLALAAIALGLYGAMYIAHAKGWWPDALYWALDQGQAIGFYDGLVEYRLYSISTLVALIPMLAVALLEWRRDISPVPRVLLWLGYALCLGLAILSGRRALWLVVLMSPFIYALLLSFQTINWAGMRVRLLVAGRLLAVSIAVFFALAAAFGLSGEKMFAYLLASAPAPSAPAASAPDVSASLRYQQAVALWQGWQEKPWFGHGHGAVAAVIRNEERPWQYELSYLALLFHTGIIGVLLYAACIGWVYWQGLRVIRQSPAYGPWMLAALAGMSGALIAHATNPYVNTFDFMWVIFLPLAIINRHLLETSPAKAAS